jgi:transportin-3
VQALYHHPDPSIRNAANQWLDDFQHTMEAWQISDSVLHDPSSSLETLYFSAQTIRTKVQRDFEDLPPSAPLSLRASLMTLLMKFRQGPAAVRTQLCLAMAALAVQMSPEDWGRAGVVQWLGQELANQPEAIPVLLELLAVFPQEANSYKIAVRPERRRQFHRDMVSSVQNAFDLLSSCLSEGSIQSREQVLRAFAAWMRLSFGISATTLASHPLVAASLAGLNSDETFDAAVDAVTELIRFTVSGSPVELSAHMPLVVVLVPQVMALRPRFAATVKVAQAEKRAAQGEDIDPSEYGEEEEEEVTKGMAYLFAEMGESYVDLISSGSSESLMIVEALAEVTSHPDDNIAAITFNFWHRLSLALTNRERLDQHASAEAEAATDVERERRLAIFRPTFELLVSLVSFRVTYPSGFENWRKDELADFKSTRYAVADMLIDAAAVLGGQETLRLLAQPLLQLAASARSGGSWDWRQAEASLYCIRAIAKAVPSSEDTFMPQVFMLLPQLPSQPQLIYTSSLTIAAFADWLGSTPSAPTLLPSLLQLLTSALAAPEDACAAAALALKHVCDACRKLLAGSADALLSVYQQAMSGNSGFNLSSDDELQLVEGLSLMVSALPPERLVPALDALCIPILTPLQQVVTAAQQAGSSQQFSSNQYSVHIDRIANIFRYGSEPEPLADVFQRMWPLLKAVFMQRATDTRTMERLCRACKYAVRNCGRALGGVMGSMLEEVQTRYQQHHHSCLLYLASEVIKVFGSDTACAGYLGTLISALLGHTITMLASIQDFTSQPDVADDCFLLASRCIRYCPHLLVPTTMLPPLVDCAMTGITIQHREACRSILTFFQDVLDLPTTFTGKHYRSAVDAVFLPRGATLTRVLVAALAGALPESRLSEVQYVLLALARLYSSQLVQWAQEAATLIPSNVVTEGERISFLQAIQSAASGGTDSSSLTNSMEEMSEVCRRNKKVMEAVQSALQPFNLTLTTVS